MTRDPIPTWFFVLCVVQRGDQFLLVHEQKHGQLWYLPAGRVEPGEDFVTAAKRETLEEGGIPIELTGIVRFEHSPAATGTRVRLIATATPTADVPPKSVADEESLEAGWFTVEEMKRLPLRDKEVREICAFVEAGGHVAPLKILGREGAPYPL